MELGGSDGHAAACKSDDLGDSGGAGKRELQRELRRGGDRLLRSGGSGHDDRWLLGHRDGIGDGDDD